MKRRVTRRHRSQSEIEKILEEYRKSGLSQPAFSKRRGIPLSTLSNWLRRGKTLGRRAKQPPRDRLVPVRVVDPPSAPGVATLELESARGYMLRFPVDLSPELLARYVEALEGRC